MPRFFQHNFFKPKLQPWLLLVFFIVVYLYIYIYQICSMTFTVNFRYSPKIFNVINCFCKTAMNQGIHFFSKIDYTKKWIFNAICWHKQPPDIKYHVNSESYNWHTFLRINFGGGPNFVFGLYVFPTIETFLVVTGQTLS